MATLGERVAVLEQVARDNRHDIDALMDVINGGGDVEYDRSVRGRLHKLETVAAAAVLRRNLGVGLLKGWERFAIVAATLATVAASWYAALAH